MRPVARGGVGRVRDAQQVQGAIDEEDQAPARPQQSRRLGDPAVGVAPDAGPVLADRQVEGAAAEGRALGIAEDQREGHAEFALEGAGRPQLGGGVVQPDDARPAPGEPRRDVGGAAAQLDRVAPGHVMEEAQVRLRDAPDAPRGHLRPAPAAARGIVARLAIPGGAVAQDMLGVARHRLTHYAMLGAGPAPVKKEKSFPHPIHTMPTNCAYGQSGAAHSRWADVPGPP